MAHGAHAQDVLHGCSGGGQRQEAADCAERQRWPGLGRRLCRCSCRPCQRMLLHQLHSRSMHARCRRTPSQRGTPGLHTCQSLNQASSKPHTQGQHSCLAAGAADLSQARKQGQHPVRAAAGAVQARLQQQQRRLASSLTKRSRQRRRPRLQARCPASGAASPRLPPRLAASRLGRPQVGA